MRILATTLMLSILPLLNGCFTYRTLHAVHEPTQHELPDRIYRVEKSVISKDNQLLIFLEGCLSNSPQKSRFTLVVPLEQIQNLKGSGLPGTNGKTWDELNLSRDAIHADWMPQDNSVDYVKTVSVGSPIPTSAAAFSRPGDPREDPWSFAKYAKLLPNTTQTVYPVTGFRDFRNNDWPTEMEFIYVDASTKQEYTIIHVDQAMTIFFIFLSYISYG